MLKSRNRTREGHPASPHPVAKLREFLLPARRSENRDLLLRPDLQLTYNARGALLEVCSELFSPDRPEILLPAFHCPSGITPAIEAGWTPVFYRIRTDLSVDMDDLLSKISPRTGAVLVIHFFGFETDLEALQGIRAKGIKLIEDWSHSFLRTDPLGLPRLQGDYQVFSFWKLAPCEVGGGILRRIPLQAPPPARLPPPLGERLVRFKRTLEEVLRHGDHSYALYILSLLDRLRTRLQSGRGRTRARAAADMPLSPSKPNRGEDHYAFDPVLARAGMPTSAKRVLMGLDLDAIAAQRRQNFGLLTELLAPIAFVKALRPALGSSTCPWVLPVLVDDRDQIDWQWRAAGVALHTFGIYLHSAIYAQVEDHQMIADAQYLAKHLLCLSIHQDLEQADMRFAATILGRPTRPMPIPGLST